MQLERLVAARPQEVYRAFVEPELLAQWFRPAPGIADPRVAADERNTELAFDTPAGALSLCFAWQQRTPGSELAFALRRSDARGAHESKVAVQLRRADGQTALTLSHEGLTAADEAEAEAAWRHGLGRLIGACPDALAAYYARLDGRGDPAARYRSRFGGLWPDRTDAADVLAAKRARGDLDAADEARFRHWLEHGWVSLPGAVSPAAIEAFRAEVAREWQRGNPDVTIELCDGEGGYHRMHPSLRERPHKLLDFHAVSAAAREIQFAPAIRTFLEQLFERAPMATQSLLFKYGTEQPMHQDTAYVVMRSPYEFVGCWVALEDVVEGSGELRYYDHSHRLPEYCWFGHGRARPPGYDDDGAFLAWLEQKARAAGCPEVRFLPKRGDALVWHADLVHGGAPRIDRARTRWSLVTHYCPVDVEPVWMRGAAGGDRVRHPRREHAPGCYWCSMWAP